jgi:PBSX family phage terminase large subunit
MIFYEASSKQQLFHYSTADEVFFGGAVGGGKSFAILWDAVLFCIKNKNVTASIFRRTYPELEKSVILEALRTVPANWYLYNKKEHRMYFKETGSILEFNYCLYDNDVYQFQSAQYDRIYFDELTHFNKFQYLYLLSRLRSSKNIKTQVKSASNPGNVGHEWVKQRFIKDQIPGQTTIRTDPETGSSYTTVYIPSRLIDNKYLTQDDTYMKNLMKLDREDRKALIEGDWDILKGQFFEEWRYDIHVCKPFEIPAWWTHIRCMDWGYTKPACVLWIAFDLEGRAYVYRELVVTKTSDVNLAAKIKDLTGKQHINYTMADPSIWSISQLERGESIAYRMSNAGVELIKGDNNRQAGWNLIHSYLYYNADKEIKPKLQIFDTCTYLIETLPGLIHDDHRPEDCDTNGDDHACFSRYTPILTWNGWTPIIDVKKGDLVWTPLGYTKVLIKQKTGHKPTWKLQNIEATANHKFLTDSGWKSLKELKDINGLWNVWSGTQSPIGVTRIHQNFRIGHILGLVNREKQVKLHFSTGIYGNIISGKYPKVMKFIIRMVMEGIITLQTLFWLLLSNIRINTFITSPKILSDRKKPGYGTKVKKDTNYIENWGILFGKIKYGWLWLVLFAPKNIKPLFPQEVNSVGTTVGLEPCGNADVYNLVTENGIFIASGYVVSNCDALRYGLMTKPVMPIKPNIKPPLGSMEYWLKKAKEEKREVGYVGTI